MIKYIDGSYECQNCPNNTIYNKTINKCLCDDGYRLS